MAAWLPTAFTAWSMSKGHWVSSGFHLTLLLALHVQSVRDDIRAEPPTVSATGLPEPGRTGRNPLLQWVFVTTVSALKVAIVILHLSYRYLKPVKAVLIGSPAERFLMCHTDYLSAVVVHHHFDMVLSSLCFCLAYAGKTSPKSYNEAKFITVILVGYFSSWVLLVLVTTVSKGWRSPSLRWSSSSPTYSASPCGLPQLRTPKNAAHTKSVQTLVY
ncbi:uncharacterized protein LOC117666885 [Pantherophis guttatus]|uniref:Uncharacterized protein LOC117666885 n=1 Tax=Pantherophis guttatus TaxID=94885 RepID=A0A6P9C898_PANGU|nr:uncharacterized protein LOC117666885 [Pantherophis guttatus]